MADNTVWEVINEFQVVHRSVDQVELYCRATTIFHYEGFGRFVPEKHNNYSPDLIALGALQIAYAADGKAIKEVENGSVWRLLAGGDVVIGIEI